MAVGDEGATQTQAAVASAGSLDALVVVLSDSLRTLAATGRSDAANRLAGRAYVALRHEHPTQAQRINVLMHVLARMPNTIQGAEDADDRPGARRPR